MALRRLGDDDMPLDDHAFYGLVWASTSLTDQVGHVLDERHGLPLSWFEVMLWLAHQTDPVPASTLGNHTMLSRSHVSRVLDALQERGLITRTRSAADGRSVEVALTDLGRDTFVAADATRRACLAPLFTDLLDDTDLAALVRIWNKLKQRRTR